jgi:acyl-CoA dehydrogenase
MDFAMSPEVEALRARLNDFMESHVYPAEAVYRDQVHASGDPHHHPQVMEDLKREARSRGLWNLFLPDGRWGPGLRNLEYAPLAEITGRSLIAPEALNCSAPDTGNMEILAEFGTEEQQQDWLVPLLEGEIRSCFAMTEPDVASSDATNIATRITRDGDSYVVDGRKWWTSGIASERCRIAIVMGVTDAGGDRHNRHSMVLVPVDTPGITVRRTLSVYGYDRGGGHAEVIFDNVRVPASNLLSGEGEGFAIAQARLGPGRIHHCMRCIGMAERAFDLMCRRAHARTTFGKRLAEQGVIQDWVAEARMQIDQARLLVLHAAWMMDTHGKRAARTEISEIKVVAPRVASWVLDRAIQVHGAGGLCDDFPLAGMAAEVRTLHIADGPDEVHKMTVARRELARYDGAA